MAFVYRKPENLSYAYLKLSDPTSKSISMLLTKAGEFWKQFATDWPFEYYFLDKSLAKLYEKDKNFGRITYIMTILAVFTACFGLLGITMFMLEAKTKEIGIRKVNGARISEIMIMLNKDFIKWVVIAFIIACPIAWYAMRKWLQNFAYKTTLSWCVFAAAGAIALVIALLTVSWQSWRAATRNPVEALRYE
jgi:putative ABC transport system permease protein